MSGAGRLPGSQHPFDARLAEVASRQHLVFSLAQVTVLGLDDSTVRRRARRGRLHRVHRGVYSLVPPAMLTVEGRYLAATLACAGRHGAHPAALSHRSAADLHGLRGCHRRTVEVIVPGRSPHRNAGIQTHRSIRLQPERDVVFVQAIPVTTVARTLLDLAAVVPRRVLERALDRAEALRVFDLHELGDQLERNPRHPGARRLHVTLGQHVAGDTITDSELEEAVLVVLRAHPDIPAPEIHGPIDPGDGGPILRPDFVWRMQRVALEANGATDHLTRHGFETDPVRDQRLTVAHWRVIRVTWRQIRDEPDEVIGRLRALLAEPSIARAA